MGEILAFILVLFILFKFGIVGILILLFIIVFCFLYDKAKEEDKKAAKKREEEEQRIKDDLLFAEATIKSNPPKNLSEVDYLGSYKGLLEVNYLDGYKRQLKGRLVVWSDFENFYISNYSRDYKETIEIPIEKIDCFFISSGCVHLVIEHNGEEEHLCFNEEAIIPFRDFFREKEK